jgi:uncharacterized protein
MPAFAFDRAPISSRRFDPDGRLHVAAAPISKATVNPYLGNEIPDFEALGLEPGRVYALLRDPDELRKAAATFDGIPLLSEHTPISADDHPHGLVVGSTGTDCSFADPYLRVTLAVWDQRAIDAIESGVRRELSCSYRDFCDLTPGTFRGERFDAVMRALAANHLSLVDRGRAGEDCAI